MKLRYASGMSRRARVLVSVAVGIGVLAIALFAARKPLRRLLITEYSDGYAPEAQAAEEARAAEGSGRIRLVKVARGFDQITDIQFVPGGGGLAVVLEKKGKARLVDLSDAMDDAPPVVTPKGLLLEVDVLTDSELGLLGLAFHPDYETNGRFFVNYTPKSDHMRTRVSEWRLNRSDLGRKRASEVRTILEQDQPYQNHDAGQLAFGPDGYLYIGFGDGGWKDDPHDNGQNLGTWLGSMLRIDVDRREGGRAYAVPKDNPFVGKKGARPEIWAYGLRNPWRYSFDPHGRLVVADVGQNRFEEIDLVARGNNMGWNQREATHCFEPKTGCRTKGLVDPIFEYGRELGTSVTGGYVYEGAAVPELSDEYLFADFTKANIWALDLPSVHLPEPGFAKTRLLGKWSMLISTFGRDEDGEVYVGDYAGGGVYRFSR